MSCRVLSEKILVARKYYICDACPYLFEHEGEDYFNELSEDEKIIIDAARADKYKILKGQHYIRQVGVYEGELYTFRARVGIHSICLDHEFYPEAY